MKKRILKVAIVMLMFTLVYNSIVNALSFTATMSASPSTTVAESKEFTIKIGVSNLDVGTTGINSLSGYLKYDKDIFEVITDSNIDGLNGWSPTYAADSEKITLLKSTFVKSAEDVFQVTFKTKSGTSGKTGKIEFHNIMASNTDAEIQAQNISTEITIGNESEPITNSTQNQGNTIGLSNTNSGSGSTNTNTGSGGSGSGGSGSGGSGSGGSSNTNTGSGGSGSGGSGSGGSGSGGNSNTNTGSGGSGSGGSGSGGSGSNSSSNTNSARNATGNSSTNSTVNGAGGGTIGGTNSSTNTTPGEIDYAGAEDSIIYIMAGIILLAIFFYIKFERVNKEMR